MVINLRIHEISRDIRKLARIFILIKNIHHYFYGNNQKKKETENVHMYLYNGQFKPRTCTNNTVSQGEKKNLSIILLSHGILNPIHVYDIILAALVI